jgi:hypothetical protein
MLFTGVGVEPSVELDGVLVAFPVEVGMGFGVVIILEELPLTELGEDDKLAQLL